MGNNMKPMDEAIKNVEEYLVEKEATLKKNKPILDGKLYEIKKVDDKIEWHKEKIKELEEEKSEKVKRMGDLMEIAMVGKHQLKNGFGIKPDNRYKLEIKDKPAFFKWLKSNREPSEVLEFLVDGIKKTALKNFCEKEINDQRVRGIMNPEIDGIEIQSRTFTRLTTYRGKKK